MAPPPEPTGRCHRSVILPCLWCAISVTQQLFNLSRVAIGHATSASSGARIVSREPQKRAPTWWGVMRFAGAEAKPPLTNGRRMGRWSGVSDPTSCNLIGRPNVRAWVSPIKTRQRPAKREVTSAARSG